MAKSPTERYEQILAADPSSLVFVELAKALVDEGQMQKAAGVCQEGLSHHPDSILGRVLWGKALLLSGQPAEAMEQFEKAGQIEPDNPYAYNLVSEILVQKRLFRSALPILRKAVALQPTDAKVRQWLDQALAESHDSLVPVAGLPSGDDPAAAFLPSWAAPGGSVTPLVAGPSPTVAVAPPVPTSAPTIAAAPPVATPAPTIAAAPPKRTPSVPPPMPRDSSAPKPVPVAEGSGPKPAPPPLKPPPVPRASTSGRARAVDLLGDLPELEGPRRSVPEVSAEEAQKLAEKYEASLREEYSLKHDAPVSWFRRHWLALTVAGSLVGAIAVASVGYILYRRHYNEQHEREFLDRAAAGLLLDTEASVTGASHQLAEVLETDPGQRLARALSAQAAATLFREFGGAGDLKAQAEGILADGKLFRVAPDPAWTARYLLSDDPRLLAADVLALPPDKSGPWVDYLAGKLLLAKGQPADALKRFNQGLKKASAHVPTLVAVGDYYLKAGDDEQAAQFFGIAHTASAQNVPAAVGLAEAHLGAHQAGPEDEKALLAVAGKGVPEGWQFRLDAATARVLAIDGQHDKAVALLTEGAHRDGKDAAFYAAALADVALASGRYLEALPHAQRAAELAPRAPGTLERYARVLHGLGRERQLIQKVAATGPDARTLHVDRAEADYALGECGAARREVQATQHGGEIPAGAAVVLALCDAADGQVAEARATLAPLLALASPPPAALLALGDVDRLEGDRSGATAAYKRAAAADASAYEPHCALGRLLVSMHRRGDGERELQAALKLDGDHAEARVAMGQALLADGKPEAALSQMQAAVKADPEDEQAALGAGTTLLALHMIPDAMQYASRAIALAPDDPDAHRLRARAAQAAKQKKLAQNELKLAAKLDKKKRAEAKAKARSHKRRT